MAAVMKRKAADLAIVPSKRTRGEGGDIVASSKSTELSVNVKDAVRRTSSLQSPIMLLTGHEAEVLAGEFSPNGQSLATGSADKQIFLWNVYGDCKNFCVLTGHKGAILDLHWTNDSKKVVSASTDKSIALWDAETGERISRFWGHGSYVNAAALSFHASDSQLIASCSDDRTVKLWDTRKREAVYTFQDQYQVLTTAFSSSGNQIFSAGIDNEIKVWDLRKNELDFTMQGHTDSVTGIALSPDGTRLLSTAMDNTVRVWDVQPFVAPNQSRQRAMLFGSMHNFEKNLLRCAWSPDGRRVSAGSADRLVNVWDVASSRTMYRLSGHNGSVNSVHFHPKEPIVMSVSSDKNIYVGELVL